MNDNTWHYAVSDTEVLQPTQIEEMAVKTPENNCEYAILFDDPDHSEEEDRFLIIGMTDRKGVCIVSHCYRGEDEKIRIISARKATKTEQNVYNEQPFWR